MRRLLARLHAQIEGFIEQRDDLILIAACSADDLPLAMKVVGDVEQASASDVFLLFTDPFVQPGPFVSVAVERLREQHRMACEALAEEGRDPLPPPPASLSDATRPPADRLRAAMDFARSLLPRGGGHRLVWAMFPQEIRDRRSYTGLISSFVPREGVSPWMRGLRLIFRDEADAAQHAPEWAKAPRVRVARMDLGPDAIAASLDEDVNDEGLPAEQRMQSLLSRACLDAAHGRTDAAVTKYTILLGYYQQTRNLTMQAFVLNGLGDIHRRKGDLDRAQHWYECAATPAAESKAPPVLATVARNLGDLAYQRKRYGEAEQYYDGCDKLAAHMLDPEGKARALEWRGLSQYEQGTIDRAIASWEAAAQLCRNVELPTFLKANLEHLRRTYRQRQMRDKLAAVEAELRDLARPEIPR
jgi:tetratricopeptide (TPR) repeat protein